MATIFEQFTQGAAQLENIAGAQANRQRFQEASNIRSLALGAVQAKGIPAGPQRDQFLRQRAEEIRARGGNPQDTLRALELPPEQQEQALDNVITLGQRAGVIQSDPDSAANQNRVGARKIFTNGTIVQSTPAGPRVFAPGGKLVTGAEAETVLQAAADAEISLAGGKAGARQTSTDLAKLRGKIDKNTIGTLRSAPVEIRKLNRLEKVFDAVGTGTEESFLKNLAKVVPGASGANLENALAATGSFVLQSLSQIKGPITEKELAFIQTIGPQVGNSAEGNRLIIGRAKQAYQDELDLAKAQRAHVRAGKNPEDFDVEAFIIERENARDAKFGTGENIQATQTTEAVQTPGGAAVQETTQVSTENAPEVTNQAQFDALPSGSVFLEDGVLRIKE